MQRLFLGLALAALISGCSAGALLLSETARQELVDNFEASLDAQQLLAEHAFALSRGDVDITGYTYTPPVGDQAGTLQINNGAFPFGTGSLTINFTVVGDNGPVDPYDVGVDLSTHNAVTVTADFVFDGTSNLGMPLSASGDFTASTTQNGLTDVSAVVAGDFGVNHDGYDVSLATNNLELAFDLATERVTNVTGQVAGTLDIPDFFYDADFNVDGQGDQLQIGIDAIVEQLQYVIALSDL